MAQQQINVGASPNDGTGDALRDAFIISNTNATDAESRFTFLENLPPFEIATLADISQFLNAGVYELPGNHYNFSENIDFGTARILLTTPNTTYKFSGSRLPLITYTGATPFITTAQTGLSIDLENIFITTPNATCIDMANNGSFIANFVVFLNCQLAANIDNFSFISFSAVPVIGCNDGFIVNNVASINMRFPQFNDNADVGGSYMTFTGANSERLIVTAVDSRPLATESFFNIQASYAGDVSIGTGVHKAGGGVFFDASGRDQTDVDIDIQNVKNVQNSTNFASGHLTGNATETVISSVDVPVKINAVWTEILSVRFTFDSSGTWTYIGKEDIAVSASCVATVDPAGGSSDTVDLYLAKNGVVIPTSKGESTGAAGMQIGAVSTIPIVTGDTIEAWVSNASDTSNLTISTASFNVGAN